jgi:hypothetical protein
MDRLLPLLLLMLGSGPLAAQSFCAPVTAEPTQGATVVGTGVPGSITTAALQAALDAGGTIRLDQGPNPSSVLLTSTLIASRATVLDGGGLVSLSGNEQRRILSIINPDPAQLAPQFTVTLQNITLRDARITDGRGAAIYKEHDFEFPHKVSLKLVNCLFENNHAPLDGSSQDDGGGAFYGELLQRIDIGACTFRGNSGSNGGAVYSLVSREVNIVDSRFENNAAIGTGGNPGNGGNGGALGVDGPDRRVDICRTQFVDNRNNAFGGAFFSVMYDSSSRSRFEDVLFDGNNQVDDVNGHSGAVYLQDGPWAMERVSFVDNQARGFGGLFVAGNAPGLIRNGTFVGNLARSGLGGAMALPTGAPIEIINTTIAHNSALFAAGISIGNGNQLRLSNTLFDSNIGTNAFNGWSMNNPASFDGGGNMQWPQQRVLGGTNGGQDVRVTAGAVFADPDLPPLAVDNGGEVPTLALPDASPARDSGVASVSGSVTAVPTTDARGQPRFGAVDRGSYEVQPTTRLFFDGFESP